MDFKKNRPTSVDGFQRRGSHPSRPAIFKDSSLGAAGDSKPKPKPAINSPRTPKPKVAPSYASPQQNGQSLIGMTLPQSNLRAPVITRSKPKSKKRSWSRPWSRKRKVVTSILTVVVILLGFAGWFGSRIVGSLDKVFHGNIFSDAQALFDQGQLKGESTGRVNILVAGDSADDPGHNGANLTDSIMVLSIDTKNHTAFMLSVPRDLWVYIPGLKSYQKINAANDVTNFSQSGYPNGGMGQLEEIVQSNLGIPIDYYALVNYAAFRDSVNALGGITINVNSPDPRGIYDSNTGIKLPNGEDTITGQQALELARARGDGSTGDRYYGFPDSDFTRTMYQREMGVAIVTKAKSAGVVTNPIKVSSLFSSLSNNVKTDLSIQNVLALAQLTKGMNLNIIGSYTYSSTLVGSTAPLLMSYRDPVSGQDALIPKAGLGNFSGLKGYYQQLTSNSAVAKEDASVVLLNGTNVTGLAGNEEKVLQGKYITNVTVADASNNYPTSMVIDNSGGKDPATKALLQKMFPGSVVITDTGSAEAKEAVGRSAAFVVVIGQNFANSNPIASNTASASQGSSTGSSTSSANPY
ncbi:MAG: LCP family protein [Candidatus Saccharibacteria bacterium]